MRTLFAWICIGAFALTGCQTPDRFIPKSDYPTSPWVKGYADPDDCLGGERLAAINIPLPDYPDRAFVNGVQGWVIVRLDVTPEGLTNNVRVERAVPEGQFERASTSAIEGWTFQPPGDAGLQACRILVSYRLGNVSIGG